MTVVKYAMFYFGLFLGLVVFGYPIAILVTTNWYGVIVAGVMITGLGLIVLSCWGLIKLNRARDAAEVQRANTKA